MTYRRTESSLAIIAPGFSQARLLVGIIFSQMLTVILAGLVVATVLH